MGLSRVNVLIGENGAGKSNLLEAIALIAAASAYKLDNEFLASRGIRVTHPTFMRQAFNDENSSAPIVVTVENNNGETDKFELTNSNEPYAKWHAVINHKHSDGSDFNVADFINTIVEAFREVKDDTSEDLRKEYASQFRMMADSLSSQLSEREKKSKSTKAREVAAKPEKFPPITLTFGDDVLGKKVEDFLKRKSSLSKVLEGFIIYSPENSSLKTFEREGQVEPLGINGEGLLKLISVISESDSSALKEIKDSLKLLGWFEDFHVFEDSKTALKSIKVKDKFVSDGTSYFDQLSTNEGFLFLLFYFALFTSKLTPKFFAIDNIDASLNPKLCEKLIKTIVVMAKKHDKQVILTTHNPSILDGLNLDDADQKLYVVSRSRTGTTKLKSISKPSSESNQPVRLSEMFIKGMLGGLPKGF